MHLTAGLSLCDYEDDCYALWEGKHSKPVGRVGASRDTFGPSLAPRQVKGSYVHVHTGLVWRGMERGHCVLRGQAHQEALLPPIVSIPDLELPGPPRGHPHSSPDPISVNGITSHGAPNPGRCFSLLHSPHLLNHQALASLSLTSIKSSQFLPSPQLPPWSTQPSLLVYMIATALHWSP